MDAAIASVCIMTAVHHSPDLSLSSSHFVCEVAISTCSQTRASLPSLCPSADAFLGQEEDRFARTKLKNDVKDLLIDDSADDDC